MCSDGKLEATHDCWFGPIYPNVVANLLMFQLCPLSSGGSMILWGRLQREEVAERLERMKFEADRREWCSSGIGSEPVSYHPAGLGSVIRYMGGIRSRVRPPADFLAFYLFIYLIQRASMGHRYALKQWFVTKSDNSTLNTNDLKTDKPLIWCGSAVRQLFQLLKGGLSCTENGMYSRR